MLDPAGGFDDALLGKLGTGAGCLGFVAEVCRAYLASVAAGESTPATVSLLEASSPLDRLDGVVDGIDVPTFLIQGENDTLFNLTESLRSARALREQGAPVKVLWHSGGHSGPLQPGEADEGLDPDDIVNARILTIPNDTALVGVPRLLDLPLASGSGETWFFAKLYDVAPDGRADLIRRQVSAVRADDLSAPLDVALPGLAHVVEADHRLRLVLASTDLAYANRRVADTCRVTIDATATDPPRLLLPLGPLEPR
ncbi:hypothetical protein BH20ACT1_BH20ACT1_08960 [soil metagenome]